MLKVFLRRPRGFFVRGGFSAPPENVAAPAGSPSTTSNWGSWLGADAFVIAVVLAFVEVVIPVVWVFACRRSLATVSRLSSFVSKNGHVFSWKFRSDCPNKVVVDSKVSKVRSVCWRNLARPCQCAKTKRRSRRCELWGSSRSPSNTGIAHWSPVKSFFYQINSTPTCKIFS